MAREDREEAAREQDAEQDRAGSRSLTARYEAMLASVPDIIMEVDANKVYTWANDAGRRFFGDDVVGREAAYYFEGEQDTYGVVQPLFDGAEDVFYVESWQRRCDGETRLLAWWCKALKDPSGRVTGALSTARDVTDRRRAEEALRAEKAFTDTVLDAQVDTFFLFEPATGLPRGVPQPDHPTPRSV
jgi:PAS domain S-box-containing protein